MPKQWCCKWIFCLLPCMALTSENPFEVFSLGNINPCNFRSGVPSLSGTLGLDWRTSKTVRKPRCCPPVIRMPCVHPYEVKQHLLNEDLSHFNCLHWEKIGKSGRDRGMGRSEKRRDRGGICVIMLQMWLVKVVRRRLGKNYCDVWNASFEMDHASVYLRNCLRKGGCVVGPICLLSVC